MKIISWNVNGIRSVQKKGFIEFIKRENPDILCIQETKAEKNQCDEIICSPTPEYEAHWTSSRARKGYSGVLTYTKRKPHRVEHGIGIEKFDREGRFVITYYDDFILYNVYFPNGAASEERHEFKQEFLDVFGKILAKKIKEKEKVILVGDYNVAHKEVDLYDPVRLSKTSGFLPEERAWFDKFLGYGFVDTFRDKHPDAKDRYSWWSYRELARPANRGWRIDYVCVSENLKKSVSHADIMDEQQGSDHCPVLITM